MGQDFCKGCNNCNKDSEEPNEEKLIMANSYIEKVVDGNNRNMLYSDSRNALFEETRGNIYSSSNQKNVIPDKIRSSNKIIDDESNRLEVISKKIKIKKIIELFRKLKKIKEVAHNRIVFDKNLNMENKFITVEGDDDIDVDLFPSKEYNYLGTKFNEKKDGFGIETFKSPDKKEIKFIGNFKNGKRYGFCKFINNSLQYTYEGEVSNNFTGQYGIYTNNSINTYYEGEWLNNRKDGYGIELYKDQSNFKGEFLNGVKDGIGKYIWADGSIYEGEWYNNKIDGTGIYSFKDGSIYSGEWKNNKMNGFGKFLFPGEKTYIGYFNDDSKSGFGVIFWYQQYKCFIGFFEKNKQNGHGKFIHNDTTKYGLWNDAKKTETFQTKEEFFNNLYENEKKYKCFFDFSYDQIKNYISKFD